MTRYNMWKTEAESEWIFPAAQESLGRRQGGAVHAPHLPSHLPDALQGPIHACLPTGPATATSQQRTATSIRRLTRSEPFWSEHGVGIAKAKRPRTQALDRRFEKYFQWDNWLIGRGERIRTSGLLVPKCTVTVRGMVMDCYRTLALSAVYGVGVVTSEAIVTRKNGSKSGGSVTFTSQVVDV